MKIAFVSGEFPPETIGGTGIYVDKASRTLAAHGHHVEVFTTTQGPASNIESNRVRVHRIPCDTPAAVPRMISRELAKRHSAITFDVCEATDLCGESIGVRAELPDLPLVLRVHAPTFIAHELHERAFTSMGRWLQFCRFCVGLIVHGNSLAPAWRYGNEAVWNRPTYRAEADPERQRVLASDMVTVPSTAMLRLLRRSWGLSDDQAMLLPNLCPPDPRLLAISRPPEGTSLLFFGRLIAFKGVFTLAKALELLRRQDGDFSCVFAGESGLSPRTHLSWRSVLRGTIVHWEDTATLLQPYVERLGDCVRLTGRYTEDTLAELLTATDICVMPSWWDNFPTACLEAMAAGRAIVATPTGGMADMLDSGNCGVLVEPNNPRALAAALLQLLRDPARRLELGRRARQRVRTVYAEHSLLARYEAAYQECIRRHRANRP
jgi:glycogen(starch) synthase